MKFTKLFLTFLSAAAFSTASFGQIAGTSHDLSGETWNTGTDEICITCHTPHNAAAVTGAVLWNHGVSGATFTTYTSGTLQGAIGAPDGTSLLCLSCHDGTVGLEDFGGAGGTTNLIAGAALVGTDLSNDHPISITYNTTTAGNDGGLYDPSTANSGLGGTIDADLLFSGNVECASCHDVHDNTNGNFLRISNAASALCLTCHNK
ncbi:cytochrome c3 family protein [Bacteroidota bacterium]